jgi:hypothetical protein
MRISISGNEGFIAPYLFSLLDGIAEEVPEEALSDSRHLDAALASAQSTVRNIRKLLSPRVEACPFERDKLPFNKY